MATLRAFALTLASSITSSMVDVLCWIKWGLLSTALVTIISYLGILSRQKVLLTYCLAFVIRADFFFKPQDLKKKYGAQWALVTGASSGIGNVACLRRALTLSRQGAD